MVKVINKKGKKYLIIDGKEYGAISLYYHIIRTISTYKYIKESGEYKEERITEVKHGIIRLIKIYNKYYPEEARINLVVWKHPRK